MNRMKIIKNGNKVVDPNRQEPSEEFKAGYKKQRGKEMKPGTTVSQSHIDDFNRDPTLTTTNTWTPPSKSATPPSKPKPRPTAERSEPKTVPRPYRKGNYIDAHGKKIPVAKKPFVR